MMAENKVASAMEPENLICNNPNNNISQKNPAVDESTKFREETAEVMPPLELPNLEEGSRGSTPCEGNTPRDCETSSSSASPVPDEQERPKRKIDLGRDINIMMQALNSLHSPEEKLAAICKKYADLLEQHKGKEKRIRGLERKLLQSGKERDQVQKELNKAVLGKSRMESLARELNKQNKLLKEESLQLTMSHNKERELVSAKFQSATDEISGRINAIADRNEVLNERNHEMSDKIEKLLEESVTREKMVQKVMEQRDLQEKILELKAKEAAGERDAALEAIRELRSQVEKSKKLYEDQEVELKSQITFYSNKVAMFQSTLDKSNDVFSKFRSEMDGMGKSMKTLEKASEYWKKCCGEVTNENAKLKNELKTKKDTVTRLNAAVQKLSELCRALQAERHELAKSNKTKPKISQPSDLSVKPNLSEKCTMSSSSEEQLKNGCSESPSPSDADVTDQDQLNETENTTQSANESTPIVA